MNLIEFFGIIIKPLLVKGRYMFSPIDNEKIDQNIYAIKDKDVNVFLYKKENDIIAIDSGYKNSNKIEVGLRKINIHENEILNVFITHLDLDHAGGIDSKCKIVFPNAKVHIGKIEEKYLKYELNRKQMAFIGLKTPISLLDGYNTLEDMEILNIGKIKIQAILVPGHTLGHLCYLIDNKYLFTGDSIILVKGEGYSFYNQWNIDNIMNMRSLEQLKSIKNFNNIEKVITSHSGFTNNRHSAFSHINESPKWREKGFKVNDNAPYNPYGI